jgi:VCBS repeat-containing protein
MTRFKRLLSRWLTDGNHTRPLNRPFSHLEVRLLEDRTLPSTLIQVANADGYVADANQDGIFDTVNSTGTSVQTSLIPSTGPATDQSCTAAAAYNYNTSYSGNLPMGQEFKPALSSLSFVDLVIADAGSDIGPGANFLVKIHSGTITGAVLGTSGTVFVADNTNITGTSNYTHFTFGSAIALSPGSAYVLEVVQTGSVVPGNSNFMLTSDNPSGANVYTPGRGIIHGTPVTTNLDFLFREGTAVQGVTERGVMEFGTPGISATSVISSAMLSATIGTLQTSASGGVGAAFYAYAGDGTITTADATASTTQIGTITNAALGSFSVNLNASAIQSLTQSSSYSGYLGILVELTSGQRFFLNSTENTAAGPKPMLQIVYDTSNHPPTAGNDSFKINSGQSQLTVNAPGVLANDSDADGDPLTTALVTGPSYGSLSLAPDGSFTYSPGSSFAGSDSFTYQTSDGNAFSNIATVSITLNHAPVVFNRSFTTFVSTPLNVGAPGILANDYDPDGDPITALAVSGPSHGTLTLNSDGSFNYVPNADYAGPDSFSYQATDGNLTSNTAVVSLVVDTLPVAQDDSYSMYEGKTLTVNAPGVLTNDSDADGDRLSAYRGTGPTHGFLFLDSTGSVRYTPNSGFSGTDSFTYRAYDGHGYSNIATVTITVDPGIPVAVDDAYSVNEDQTLTVLPAAGVTSLVMQSPAGEYIGQGQNYNYSTSTGRFNASRNYDNGVSIAYQDASDINGWWYLDFAAPGNAPLSPGTYLNATRYPFQAANVPGLDVSGEGRGGNTLTGQFTVLQAVYGSSNQISRFDATFIQHTDGQNLALTGEIKYNYSTALSGVLINDSDADGDALSAVLVAGPAHGAVTLNSDGSFSYKPDADFNGTDSFTYKANDGANDSNIATVSITVNPVNDAPSFTKGADQTNVEGDGPQTVTGWATAISPGPADESNQALNFLVSTTNDALFAAAPAIDPTTGTLTYTPAPGAVGTATVSVKLHDSGGTDNGGSDTSAVQTFTITIDDAVPTLAIGGDSSTDEGSSYSLTLSATDPDPIEQWTITWGDGDVQTVSGNPPSVSHVYADGPNDFTIRATATDEDGTYDAGNTVAVSVNNVAPTLALGGSSVVNERSPYSLGLSSSDPGQDTISHWTITWGDGSTQTVDGNPSSVTHIFAPGNYTVTATATDEDGAYDAGNSIALTVNAVRFVVTGPAAATAGSAFDLTVAAVDPSGNAASGYLGTVHFTSSDALAGLPADYAFVEGDAGSHAFASGATLDRAGVQTITAADALSGSAGSISVNVSAAAASQFALSAPATTTAGAAATVTVTALDPFSNVADGYSGTVHFTSSDGQASLLADSELTAGVGSFSLTLATAGQQSIVATDTNDSSLHGSVTIVVNAASASHFNVAAPPNATAGAAFGLTVTALDPYGNMATSYLGTIHFTSSDSQATEPADYTFGAGDAGIHSFAAGVTLDTAGAQSISAVDSATGITGAVSVNVSAAAASRFQLAGPATTAAGSAFTASITAFDPYNNVATGYTGTVHFTSSDPQAVLPADTTLSHGVGSFSTTLKTAGVQSVTATDTSAPITGALANIRVIAAAAAGLTASALPSPTTAGIANSITVMLRDAFGNVATGYTGAVHFTSSDIQAGLPADYPFTASDAGAHTFTVTLKTAGTQSITINDVANSSLSVKQAGITVTGAAATHFAVTGYASSTTAGLAHAFTVTAFDGFGNVAIGYTGTVHFSSSDIQAAMPPDYTFTAADGGVRSFSATLKTAGSQSITVADRSNSAISGSQSGISVVAGVATHFAISAPASVKSQTSFTIVVTALDAFGNVATGYRGRVHFSSSDHPAKLPGDYTFTSGDAGVHTFTLSLKTPGVQYLALQDRSDSSISGSTNVTVQ